MACCLTAPSHYLNQCWLIVSEILKVSSAGIMIRTYKSLNQGWKLHNIKTTSRSPRDQRSWLNWFMFWFINHPKLLAEWFSFSVNYIKKANVTHHLVANVGTTILAPYTIVFTSHQLIWRLGTSGWNWLVPNGVALTWMKYDNVLTWLLVSPFTNMV